MIQNLALLLYLAFGSGDEAISGYSTYEPGMGALPSTGIP